MEKNESKMPFIHLIKAPFGKYMYDVNKNQILQIPERVYSYLEDTKTDKSIDEDVAQYIHLLKENGFLKENHVEISEHPYTEYYSSFLHNKLTQLTLQVTRRCNLNCEYCMYSGKYYTRQHEDKWMTIETAQKAIDYFINNSRDVESIWISFYGGEPLLAFELIKKCVAYVATRAEGRKVSFNFTTNGTLLTAEKLDFLVEHQFNLLISLDGPENIHDKHRKFVDGRGSFYVLMKNIQLIKERYPEYYKTYVAFNTVLDPLNGFDEINAFIKNNKLFDGMHFSSSIISDVYSKDEIQYSEKFIIEFEYEMFKLILWKLGRLEMQDVSPLLIKYLSTNKRIANMMEEYSHEQIMQKNHRGGPCLPGVRKLFVSVDGELYPCERVSETSDAAKLGHIDQGISLENAIEVLNIEQKTSEKCRKCWAYYYCGICVAKSDDGNEISAKKITESCEKERIHVEKNLLDYIVLREKGYNREFDL